MKKALLFFTSLFFCCALSAQTIYKEFDSRKLNSKRELKIELPKNYDADSDIKYPVIIVFDGEYLFEPVVGQTKFQTYFDEMPEPIVVGVVQGKERFYDSYHDEVTGLPIEFGAKFYEFISLELLPYIDSKYNTSKFRVAVGQDLMSNFMNSFLLKDKPLFQAYINLSPDFKGAMSKNIANRLDLVTQDIFYYMATSDGDFKAIQRNITEADIQLKKIANKSLNYYFDEFKDDSHYSLVPGALSKALSKIFELYKPLGEKELKEKVLTYEGTLDTYIIDRSQRIQTLFGIQKPITEEDFEKMAKAADERSDLESLERIGKLANKQLPKSSLGTYYLALHAEKTGKTKKAVKLYESALDLDATAHINKEFILSQVEKLKLVGEETEDKE